MFKAEDYRLQIEAALAYAAGSHTFDDVAAGVAAGTMQLWLGPNSVMVTELVDYPRYRALRFFLAGGRMPELEAMTPGVLDWGREQGCARAEFLGRRGWQRSFLTRSGWRDTQLVALEKQL